MMLQSLLIAAALAPAALACPQHQNLKRAHLDRRQTVPTQPDTPNTAQNDWAYEASFNWGKINPNYTLCQTGTQQSPIALSLNNGLSLNHIPTFNYNGSIPGTFYNWGYGPAFNVARDESIPADQFDWSSLPSVTYDNATHYLVGWHIHAPADHSVGGDRSKAELHLVHVDATGGETSVFAIRLDPGNSNSTFFDQLPPMIGFNETNVLVPTELDLTPLLSSVLFFNEFWTYEGSLTSPPCTEGLRWFVARQILFTGVEQMQEILGASTYSARAEQEVWQHRINE